MRRNFRQRGYDARWDKLAVAFLRQCPHCVGCWACGVVEPAVLVDHIRPRSRYRDQDACDSAGLQASCRFHHDVVKRAIEVQVALGQLPEAALKLDSIWAQRLTKERFLVPVGVDGYREWEWNQLPALGVYPYKYNDGGRADVHRSCTSGPPPAARYTYLGD